jgi:hypothetical protein
MPLSKEEPMVRSDDPTARAMELARSATPATAQQRTALAAVAKPAAEVAGLLLVEVLGSPRARAAALGLARSLACRLAGRRLPASAHAEVTTRRVTVITDADTSVLVHCAETALVVLGRERPREWPAFGPQTRSAACSPADQATAVGTVLLGAGRYPPPPSLSPLLLGQPAKAKLSTRTSRTAVTTSRVRLMANLLVAVFSCVFSEKPDAPPKRFPVSVPPGAHLR